MKREPYGFKIAGILCLFNIPVILFFTVNNYSIWRITGLILVTVVIQFMLAIYISNLLYFYHKSIVENMVKIKPTPLTKTLGIISPVWCLAFYYVFLYLLTQRGSNIEDIIPILNTVYLPYLLRQGTFCSCYIGDKNLIYGNIQVKLADIETYEIKTKKKYKNGKRDRIQLKILPKNGKEILVLDSSFSYKLIEELDKVFEQRFIDEKMKEYGLT